MDYVGLKQENGNIALQSKEMQEKKFFENYIDGRNIFNNQLNELLRRTYSITDRLDLLATRLNGNEYPKNNIPKGGIDGTGNTVSKEQPPTLLAELSRCDDRDDSVYRQIDIQLSEIFEAITFLEKHF